MLSGPPAPPAGPPARRYFGRRITRIPALIVVIGLFIVIALFAYDLNQRAQQNMQTQQLTQATPSGADASGILKNAPDGYIPAAIHAVRETAEKVADTARDTTKKVETPDDNGREKAREEAWKTYWSKLAQIKEDRFSKRKEAIAELKTSVLDNSPGKVAAAAAPAAAAPAATGPAIQSPIPSSGGIGGGLPGYGGFFPGLGPTAQIDREGQEQKLQFAGQQGDTGQNDVVPGLYKPPVPNAVMAGSYIKMSSENVLISDVPGIALGRVTQSVYNTSDGTCVMIPQNSKILGKYNSVVSAGQTRLPGVMTRIIYPDGSSQPIGAMEVADNEGAAGWEDEVNRHLLLKFGSAAVAGMFGAAIQLSVPQNSLGNGYSAPQIIGASIGQQMGQLGQQMTQQNLSIPNTLKIRKGVNYTIITDRDLIIPPWRCEGAQGGRRSMLPIMTSGQ